MFFHWLSTAYLHIIFMVVSSIGTHYFIGSQQLSYMLFHWLLGTQMTVEQFLSKLPQSVMKAGKIIDIRSSIGTSLQVFFNLDYMYFSSFLSNLG